jgi:ATP-dependent protease HslVU (ClpYQ) ATPase subunit
MKKFIIILGSLILPQIGKVCGQSLPVQQKNLQATIKSAYKGKKITEKEYLKLMEEQEIIKNTMAKAQADDVVTPDEKNKIHSKLVRARKRLAKYRTNREVY